MTAEVWYGCKPRSAPLQQTLVNVLDFLAPRAEHYVLLSSVWLVRDHADIDLIVLKRDGIFLVEIMHAWDPIIGEREGAWHVLKPDGARLPLNGGRLNPFRQVQTHYVDWRNWLTAHSVDLALGNHGQIGFTDILSYVVIEPDVPAESRLAIGRHAIQIASLRMFLAALVLRSSARFDLTPQMLHRVPRLLGLESPLGASTLSTPRRKTQKLTDDYQPARIPSLVALGHDLSVPVIRLKGARLISIGRDDDNDVVIHHPAVSRHHAQLVCSDERWLVRDLGSDNGTYLGPIGPAAAERRVGDQPDILSDQGVVRFGPAAYVVSL